MINLLKEVGGHGPAWANNNNVLENTTILTILYIIQSGFCSKYRSILIGEAFVTLWLLS